MSNEMAVGDKVSQDATVCSDEVVEEAIHTEQASQPSSEALMEGSKEEAKPEEESSSTSNTKLSDDTNEKKDDDDQKGKKRRASSAFSDEPDTEFKGFEQSDCDLTEFNKIVDEDWKFLRRYSTDEDFKGFDSIENSSLSAYSQILDNWQAQVSEAEKLVTPLRNVLTLSLKIPKRPRQDTDSSRPSSALSSRSEGDGTTDPQRINGIKEEIKPFKIELGKDIKASSSPANRGRRPTVEMSSPLLRVPLERGWKRELVYRAALDAHSRRNADIYYYMPGGKKLRSTREVAENLSGSGLTLENFSFFKEPLGIDDPEKEIIRDAKVIRRVESPVPPPTQAVADLKRTPKPRPPKGASPEPAVKSPPAKIKVKSIGSRLNNNSAPSSPATPKQPRRASQTQPPADNNNTAWKKPSEKAARRVTNGASPPPAALPSPRRRGRTKADDAAHFSNFHASAREKNYNVALQIFQYVGMRDLARCARVCKLWQTLTDTPALWRHVRMKNSHVSDWGGLCAVLKKRSTKWLDLRKMLLPSNDTVFWDQFIESIGSVDTLERLELCRCPARVVEAVCRRVSSLRALCAPAICDTVFDPEPLAELPRLELLRLKSLKGLSLTRNLQPLSALSNLQHLSLTSIKELGWCACEVVGELEQLESLELGECSFGSPFAAALSKLVRLRRLRLERGVPHCAASALLKALASLPKLTRLELVNFDVKVGFDDALAECKNIQRLLIIPTYVSQSATTNKQVLSGVLRLKDTLTHLMWGVTIELLRVTELFIDQCEAGGEAEAPEGQGARRELGECIPVLKPVPGCRLPDDLRHVAGPPQVEILPIPTLQRLLSAQLPNTKLKLLRIPFHATWRQTLADFQ
ncbi:uncharacterized protein LOC125050652 isoform X2 [Pieris napi]|uniref:uncharacterized protein LOC125050652 isoform X2 n=1 Tax=Pieris napi TaxID=78633 RepID=UPI001FBA37D6|nr:uncharacterized protein LOC125050652 isoform X2 [Pieris napi]